MAERGPLSEEQVAELAELGPKAQQWQKKKDRDADRYRAMTAAAARVAELEALAERGLAAEQEVELAELRPKAQQWQKWQKRKDADADRYRTGKAAGERIEGPEGVSGWTGADQDDLDTWSADVDLDAWLDQAVADLEAVQVPQGAADAGAMLGEGAYEEFIANELPAFLGQDTGDDAAGPGGVGSVAACG
ncbi:hypothetical protein [Saccharopolyspora spinosa]|uniref:hypothetical protein n=1 Tax=Saccharopolyspora spinosa TaxID=60894 RepID=UPI00376EE55A